jgi:hypothetical protein
MPTLQTYLCDLGLAPEHIAQIIAANPAGTAEEFAADIDYAFDRHPQILSPLGRVIQAWIRGARLSRYPRSRSVGMECPSPRTVLRVSQMCSGQDQDGETGRSGYEARR